MNVFSGYITNAGRYSEGRMAGEWLSFPSTQEAVQDVLARIGVDGSQYEEWFFTDYHCDMIPSLTHHLGQYDNLDELNYLAVLIQDMDGMQRETFAAALEYGESVSSVGDIINTIHNLDCFTFYPDITDEATLGEYMAETIQDMHAQMVEGMARSKDPAARTLAGYIDTLESYRDYERFGRDLSINEGGRFNRDGYIMADWQGFQRIYDGHVPEQRRLKPYPIRPPARSRTRYLKQKRRPDPARGGR